MVSRRERAGNGNRAPLRPARIQQDYPEGDIQNMKRGIIGIAQSVLTLLALTFIAGCPAAGSAGNNFSAQLTGAKEVPPVTTNATGTFTAEITDNDQAINVR